MSSLHESTRGFVFAVPTSRAMIPRILFVLILLSMPLANVSSANPGGRWVGSWSSHTTGHTGPLRARIRSTGPNTYRALFAGRFAKVVPFIYPAKLTRVPGTSNRYQSSARLPLLGQYRMTATVSGRQFYATFRGRRDSGVFRMSR